MYPTNQNIILIAFAFCGSKLNVFVRGLKYTRHHLRHLIEKNVFQIYKFIKVLLQLRPWPRVAGLRCHHFWDLIMPNGWPNQSCEAKCYVVVVCGFFFISRSAATSDIILACLCYNSTLQKKEVCAQLFDLEKHLNICYVYVKRKPK